MMMMMMCFLLLFAYEKRNIPIVYAKKGCPYGTTIFYPFSTHFSLKNPRRMPRLRQQQLPRAAAPEQHYGQFPIGHFYRIEALQRIKNRRFKVGVYKAAFQVLNIKDAPEGRDLLMEELLGHFIAEADRSSGILAEKCSIIIRSAILEKPIQIPYRGLAQNTPQVVMQQFDDVDQSGKRMGRPSLYSQPIHIEIVMGPSDEEALELVREARGGTGRKRRVIEHGVNMQNLIPVRLFIALKILPIQTNNQGPLASRHCLLLAVQLTMLYKRLAKYNRRSNKRFQRLVHSDGAFARRRRCMLVLKMIAQMNRHGIRYPLNERTYTVDKHLPMVQSFLDARYPQMYRLSVFGQNGRMRPMWKSERRARHELCLFLLDRHYYGVRKVGGLFCTPYCIDCERPYESRKHHRAKCVAKCARCCGMGLDFPCKERKNYFMECPQCHNIFRNPSCHQRHLDEGICALYKRCLKCGQIYRCKKQQCQDGESDSSSEEEGTDEERSRVRDFDNAHEDDDDDAEGGAEPPNEDGHSCFMRYCNLCRSIHDRDEPCYVQPIVPKEKHSDYLMIIYDFECVQLAPDSEEWNEDVMTVVDDRQIEDKNFRLHQVNCVSAMLLCSRCMRSDAWKAEGTGDCKVCGPKRPRMHTWTTAQYDNPLREFLDWLIVGLGPHRQRRTYAIAHYGGRYDMHLLLGELLKFAGIEPKITRSGNKLYEVLLKRNRLVCPYISFRDSFNWMSLKLEQLPKALGLEIDEGGKAFFPHGWNLNRNMNVCLPHLPDRHYYYPESMGKQRREAFERWHEEHWGEPFCLRDQIGPYCEQDVRVLAHAAVKFQQLFFSLATEPEKRDDVLVKSLTLASINYLEKRQIAIIPDNGYHRDSNQSVIALKYLRWLATRTGWQIQTRDSAEGERRLRLPNGQLIRLDGYVADKKLALEFLGCAWHGHDCLFRPYEICLNGKTALFNRDALERRRQQLRAAGLNPLIVWECRVKEMLRGDPDMADFFEEQPEQGPLFPRDAFQGGRTGPLWLKCDLEEGDDSDEEYEISDFDVVSLYPSVNFKAWYPIGHPEVIELNTAVSWTRPEQLRPYRGLFKLFIIPPDDLYLPVIAERMNGKLVFHLCHQCAIESTKGEAVRQDWEYTRERGRQECPHTDKERGFVCTISSVELELALGRGYRATWIYSIYHWAEWSDTLLRPYVQDMMRLKIQAASPIWKTRTIIVDFAQASGWPKAILNCEAGERKEAMKREYVERNEREYGIKLDPEKIERNEGLRYLAKVCANSMWGRWGLRCNLTKDLITGSPVELHSVLNDPKLDVGSVEMLAPGLFAVPYQRQREFVRPHDKYNIVLALITTANARVRLYEFMEAVVYDPDCRLLYTDTDSCIVRHKKGQEPPFPVGDMLGQMSREYEDYQIMAFYCGGCKQYAMKLRHRTSGEIMHVVKCRGCWERADSPLDYAQFQKMVNLYGEEQEGVELERTHFRPDWRRGQVTTRSQKRRYAPIYDKGLVDAKLHCYPYGYRGAPVTDHDPIPSL